MARTPPRPSVHGWVILDKPKGMTSTQALGKVRRIIGGTKAGHGGTLDPLATGILPLAFGEATKLIPYIMDGEKEYEFTIKWGESRDTDDAEGKVIAASAARPTEETLSAKLPQFRGRVEQTPPAYSAIKIAGARAYDIARAGGTPDIKPRNVDIFAFDLVKVTDPDHATFRVRSGKGMYVRALARDLAGQLNCHGHITQLRRTRVGPFDQSVAIELSVLERLGRAGEVRDALRTIETGMPQAPILVTAAEAERLRTGQGILIRPAHGECREGATLLTSCAGSPVAVVEARNGELRVIRGFHF